MPRIWGWRMADVTTPSPPKHRLAVIIPAYGRGDAIAGTLTDIASEAREAGLDIGLYVSDDTPDASVEDPVRAVSVPGYPVHYRRNMPSLRHDRNLVASLLWPDADYVWLLGSGRRLVPGQLARVMAFLDDQDLAMVESHSGDPRVVPSLAGEEARRFVREALWHQTMTGTTLYGRRVRDWARARGEALIVMPNFPQISIIAGFLSDRDGTVGWFGERTVTSASSDEPSYWRATAMDVFVDDWARAVTAFPGLVPPADRTHVIRKHSARSRLFDTTALIDCRRSGQLRWSSLRNPRFHQAMHEPVWKTVAVLALPLPVLDAAKAAWMRIRGPRQKD
jgi:hypothetical protein